MRARLLIGLLVLATGLAAAAVRRPPMLLDMVGDPDLSARVSPETLAFYSGAVLTGDLPAGVFQLRKAPRSPETKLLLASLLEQAGHLQEALALARDGDAAPRFRTRLLADIALSDGALDEAVTLYRQNGDHAALAYALLWLRGPAEAARALGTVREPVPVFAPEMQVALALIQGRPREAAALSLREVEAARRMVARAARRGSGAMQWVASVQASRVMSSAVNVLRETGHAAEATALLDEALRINPGNPQLHLQRLDGRPELAEAVWTFHTCGPLRPHYDAWRLWFASRGARPGPGPDLVALPHLGSPPPGASDAAPGALPADPLLAFLKEHGGGRFALLRGHLRGLAATDPRNARVQALLGGALVLAGEDAAGEEALGRSEALDPNQSLTRRFRADLAARRGRLDEALHLYDEAARAAARPEETLLAVEGRGIALLWKGDPSAAGAAFTESLALAPPAYRNLLLRELGFTFWLAGRAGDAERCLIRAVAEYPESRQGFGLLLGFAVQQGDRKACRRLLLKVLSGRRPIQAPQSSWVALLCRFAPPDVARRAAIRCFRHALQPVDLARAYQSLGNPMP